MTATVQPVAQPEDPRAKRAVAVLIWAQAVLGAQMPVHFTLGGLAGAFLASNPALATLPISMTVMGSMFAAPAMSHLMGRLGRRTGFMIGAASGAIGGTLGTIALFDQNFALFCAGSFLIGIYLAAHGFYRFAATDMASEAFRPKAISYVMAGGLLAALMGAEFVKLFGDALAPVPFAGAYAFLVILNVIGAIPLLLLDIPTTSKTEAAARPPRPWAEILKDRRVPVAMACAMICYALMNLIMTATPLAMIACGFVTGDAAEVVRIHVLAMYIPSFFTGALIVRFGAQKIIMVGLICLAGAAVTGLSGIAFGHFVVTLALAGLGWNFGFIGATALLTAAHRPEERAKVQGVNDFLVFGLVTVASFSSGALLSGIGWEAVQIAILPFLLIATAALFWLRKHKPL